MTPLTLLLPGRPPLLLRGEDGRAWHFGRSHENEVVFLDGGLSRRHARIVLQDGTPCLEDLGSRNGTFVNDEPIQAPRALQGGEEIRMGSVRIRVTQGSRGPEVRIQAQDQIDSQQSLVLSLDQARKAWTPAQDRDRTGAVIRALQELSLELIKDAPADALLTQVLDQLWTLLSPWRAAILMKEASGELRLVVSRANEGQAPILLSRSLVESALERKEAVLFREFGLDMASPSILLSGITTAILTPLEYEGTVLGLLYLDARPPRGSFNEQDLGLATTFAHLASAKLEQVRLREAELSRRKLDHELDLARRIQQGLLPGFPPEIPGYQLYGTNLPSRQVSGDLFGWWPRGDGRWLIALADVSGKGLGPGLLMASLAAFLEAWAGRDVSTETLAFHLSKALARHTDGRRFVTAFLALLDPATGLVTYTNAGHNPGFLLLPGEPCRELESQGLPLAMLPGQGYGSGTFLLPPGGLLALYTDGITEAADPKDEEYTPERLKAFLMARAAAPVEALDAELMAELEAHAQGTPFADDRTLLLLRRS
ncbi:SpoIIE family protein phosphatase [Geothrix oryzisoli]|uniref:SpoIIE family protein phosphatase n=1 Tax=Geothrix oryzisoli TaxID=2922721 RepID=UPI0023DFC3D0|nr:SpoIIE family protein phosphatase [Geothrix oryzisoli]